MRTPFQVNDRELRSHLRAMEKQTPWFITGFIYFSLAVMIIGYVGRATGSKQLLTIGAYGLGLIVLVSAGALVAHLFSTMLE